MRAVRLLAGVELRRRWGALIALGVLAGLIGAVVLTAVAGARRTDSAFDRLLEATRAPDAVAAITERPGVANRLVADGPGVTAGWRARAVVGQDLGAPDIRYYAVTSGYRRDPSILQPIVVEGRLPDPASVSEVVISEEFSESSGKIVGDIIRLGLLSQEQFDLAGTTVLGSPAREAITLRVVGVVRQVEPPGEGLLSILATPAFYGTHATEAGGRDLAVVRLQEGEEGISRFRATALRLGNESGAPDDTTRPPVEVASPHDSRDVAADANGVLVAGLYLFAGVAGVAGIVALVQALSRHHDHGGRDRDVELALGLTRVQRVAAATIPGLVIAAVAVAVSAAWAVVASPLTPVASARRLEPDPGLLVDSGVLAVGAFAVALAVLALDAAAATLADSRARLGPHRPVRTSDLAERLSAMGAAPPAVIGTRFALEPGSGRTRVPVRSAITGAVIGVTGIVATTVFGASLDRLVDTPARYGWFADIAAEVSAESRDAVVADMLADPSVAGVATVNHANVDLGGAITVGYAVNPRQGDLGPTVLEGQLPRSPNEVAVGPAVLERLDLEVGDLVRARVGRDGSVPLEIVGVALMPALAGEALGNAAVLSSGGLARVQVVTPTSNVAVRLAPGVDADRFIHRLGTELEVIRADPPADVANVGQLHRLPRLLAGFLALLAMAAVGHALVTAVRRRRHDLAILAALGFERRQAGFTMLAMATVTILIGIGVGVPLGLLLASGAWARVATSLYVEADLSVPVGLLAVLAVAAVVLANVVAVVPAWLAARQRPAPALHSE